MKLRKGYVYGITNIVTGQWYVGKTANARGLRARWQYHRYTLRHNIHKNRYLQNSWNKYGEKSFMFVELFSIEMPLEEVNDFIYKKEEEISLEKKASIEDGGFSQIIGRGEGRTFPKYIREKIRKSQKGIPRPHVRGWKHTEETRKRLSISHTGKRLSEETKRKIGNAFRGRIVENNRGKYNKLSKPIVQLDRELNFIKYYDSGMDAHRETKINRGHIGSVCQGNRKTAGGYVWMFEEDYIKLKGEIQDGEIKKSEL